MCRRFISLLLLLVSVYSVMGMHLVSCSDDNLAEVFRVLKENGLSDIAASAIVGNAAAESRGSPSCVEAGEKGKGIGVFQQSLNSNRQALEDYCSRPEHKNCPKVTLSPAVAPKSYVVCNVVKCQVLATLEEFSATIDNRHWSGNYNNQVSTLAQLGSSVADGAIPGSVSIKNSWYGFKSQTDLFAATVQFMCDYETPGSSRCMWVGIKSYSDSADSQNEFVHSVTVRYNEAKKAYNTYAGKEVVLEEPVVGVVEEPVEEVVEEPISIIPAYGIGVLESTRTHISGMSPERQGYEESSQFLGVVLMFVLFSGCMLMAYVLMILRCLDNFESSKIRSSKTVKLATIWMLVGFCGYVISGLL